MSLKVSVLVLVVILVCNFVLVRCASSLDGKSSHIIKTGTLDRGEPRKKQQQQDVFSRILPMLATPFIMQTTFLPIVLIGMKVMLMNSLFIGKLALILWAINLYRGRNDDSPGVYSHNVNVNHNDYPGHSYGVKYHRFSEHYGSAEDRSHRRKKRFLDKTNTNNLM